MEQSSNLELVIRGRDKDLGGFSVHRVLPYMSHRMVGPFIFFDHMGPAVLKPHEGMSVRPHPHINLATVTYLFEGTIRHQDSLGSDQLIEPGAINWMTAGRGIVHSERTPDHLADQSLRMNGIQLWVALPEEFEEIAPSFSHHPKASLPLFKHNGIEMKLLLGKAFGHKSPVPVHSEMFYIEVKMKKGESFELPAEYEESAVYAVDGKVRVEEEILEPYSMAIAKKNAGLSIHALDDSRIMLLGGKPLGKRFIFWNFVSSSEARIEEAKEEWRKGPQAEHRRFQLIPGDNKEFIPLPEEPARNPKGTIM